MILASALMFDHINQPKNADRIRKAVRAAVVDHDRVTPDLDDDGTTESFTDAVIERISAGKA